jgi:glyoxylase-like metal-dependent hydrolase (beta-lactamase superfamily II)
MFESLHHTLGALPDATLLYPGHLYASEPSSTMGEQKRTNPYLRVSRLDDFLSFMGVSG